jgi:hypothetical protein
MIKRYNNTKFKSVFDWFQCDWKDYMSYGFEFLYSYQMPWYMPKLFVYFRNYQMKIGWRWELVKDEAEVE